MNSLANGTHRKITSRIYHSIWEALDWIYPPQCIICNNVGFRICPECLDKFIEMEPGCEICGKPLHKSKICKDCRSEKPVFDQLRSLFEYKDIVRMAVHQIKFHNDLGLAEYLGQMMSDYLSRVNWNVDLIIPLPLNRNRQSQRGYNQSALLAKPIALNYGIKYAPFAIERNKETLSQVGLSASERLLNVTDAFTANKKAIANKNLLIIDDVVTTGATMNAVAIAAKKGGAENIYCLSFARAIKHNLDII